MRVVPKLKKEGTGARACFTSMLNSPLPIKYHISLY
jgi:hypothetical protein